MRITFKEFISEARKEGVTYNEKSVKGVLERVTAELQGNESATFTRLAKRYERLEVSLERMKKAREEMNGRLKESVQDYFKAEDAVVTRVVQTAQFTLTLAKEVQGKPKEVVDHEAIAKALIELIPAELQTKIDEIRKQYTKIQPPSAPVPKLSVKKIEEGVVDWFTSVLRAARYFFVQTKEWGVEYDKKLSNLKKQLG
jgi:type I site-specific restriction endonuclease